jgi:pyrroloquinoline quinone (PQQ) biosynthesis protein C
MSLTDAIRRSLADKQLLAHPFYRRWEEGALHDGELAAYGAQYAHLERQLPLTLSDIVDASEPGPVRDLVQANLDDELHRPCAHVELLDSFLAAVGSSPTAPTPATEALVELYRTAPSRGVDFALGVVSAYEVQAAAVARSKADGLRAFYGLTDDGTAFWDVHASIEDDHAAWTLEAAGALDPDVVLRGAAASRDAWWAFLDEREALAPVG